MGHRRLASGVDYITKPFQIEEVLARVEAHLVLHALQRRLAATNAELRALAHTVAHDLESPLGIILGFSTLLESDLAEMSPDEIVENLDEIA